MSKAKYSVFKESNLPVNIEKYQEDDEYIYGVVVSTLSTAKKVALIALEEIYRENKEYILNLHEKDIQLRR